MAYRIPATLSLLAIPDSKNRNCKKVSEEILEAAVGGWKALNTRNIFRCGSGQDKRERAVCEDEDDDDDYDCTNVM